MISREQLEKELAAIENKLYELAILDNKDEQYELESLLEEQSYVQAYQSSYSFLAHSWQTFNGEVFLPAKHLHAIAEHLDATLTGEIKRLIINVPPRTAKSALVTKAFPAYCWIRQPHLKFANVSYGYGLAEEGSVHSRQIMQSDWYKRGMATVWRDMGAIPWEFRRDKNMKNDYENNANGRRFATSCPEGIFTGIGADTIIIDDPVKANAAYSKNTLDKVNQWVSNTLMSRLNNQSEGVIILVQQRVAEMDMTGFFLQQEGVWEHLCLPMEYEDTQRYWTRIGWTDWRTNQNELLEPVRFPRDVVERLKKDEEWSYASQYQQQPVPLGGGLIRREWWQNWYVLPTQFDATCMAFDLSMNDKETSDNTSLIVMGRKDNKFYIIDLVYGKMDILKQVESIIELCNKYPMIRTRLIEQRANGDAVIALLKRTITGLIPLITKGDKEQRILSCVPEINAGNVLVPDENVHNWIKPLLLEATMFPRGKNDDAIDSMQMALNHLVTSNIVTYMPLQVITDNPGNTTRAEIREHIMDSSYGTTVNVTRNYIKGLFE